MKRLTSNAVTLFDDKLGTHVTYVRGHEFDDDDPQVKKLGPFHFEVRGPHLPEEIQYYEDLKMPELIQMCRDRNIDPASNRKVDVIEALKEYDERQGNVEPVTS